MEGSVHRLKQLLPSISKVMTFIINEYLNLGNNYSNAWMNIVRYSTDGGKSHPSVCLGYIAPSVH